MENGPTVPVTPSRQEARRTPLPPPGTPRLRLPVARPPLPAVPPPRGGTLLRRKPSPGQPDQPSPQCRPRSCLVVSPSPNGQPGSATAPQVKTAPPSQCEAQAQARPPTATSPRSAETSPAPAAPARSSRCATATQETANPESPRRVPASSPRVHDAGGDPCCCQGDCRGPALGVPLVPLILRGRL